jgi:hypothetical protein
MADIITVLSQNRPTSNSYSSSLASLDAFLLSWLIQNAVYYTVTQLPTYAECWFCCYSIGMPHRYEERGINVGAVLHRYGCCSQVVEVNGVVSLFTVSVWQLVKINNQ